MIRRSDHYMILTQPDPRRVLLLASEQGYSAPEWELQEGFWTQLMARVTNTFAAEQLGLPVTLLEIRPGNLIKSNGRRAKAYFLEGHDPAWSPPAGSLWIDVATLAQTNLAIPELAPLLQAWLTGPQPAEPDQPPAPEWILPGWLDEVEQWVREQLAHNGVRLTGKLEQLKTWSISCVLRFPTDHGDYFFKATPQVFQQEPFFTAFLAEHFPNEIPQLTAIEPARGWMLMPDFQAQNLENIADIAVWEGAARRYARFQIEALGLTETLLEKGCRDRRLDRLGAQFEAVVTDMLQLPPDLQTDLTPEELAKLADLVPVMKKQIAELDAFGLPMSIMHGDLNSNNVALTKVGQFIYYDWTDLTVSHPFLDLDAFLNWGSRFEKEIPDWQVRVSNAYLEAWTVYLPMDQLIQAFEIAAGLAIMVQALNYYWIFTKIEASGRWEFEDFVSYYFRRILKSQSE